MSVTFTLTKVNRKNQNKKSEIITPNILNLEKKNKELMTINTTKPVLGPRNVPTGAKKKKKIIYTRK
jgi:hypothetical protein